MRLKNIILMSLAQKRLIAYDKLERIINKDIAAEQKEDEILNLLEDISMYNNMVSEWEKITTPNELPLNVDEFQSRINNKEDE